MVAFADKRFDSSFTTSMHAQELFYLGKWKSRGKDTPNMGRLIDKGGFSENISLFFILKGRERWEEEGRGSGGGQSIKVETD